MFDIGFKCLTKIFMSETIGPRALIFGVYHHLVDLYQFCSNYTPWAKNGTPWGSHVLLETSIMFFQVIPLGPKWSCSRGQMFYIGLLRENMKNLLV